MLKYTSAPKDIQQFFEKAEAKVIKYFQDLNYNPKKGKIEISGERYIFVRANSMSVDFFRTICELFSKGDRAEAIEFARNFLYDISYSIGKADAKEFHKKMKLKSPMDMVSAGASHLAFTGWGFIKILKYSMPVPKEDFSIVFTHDPNFQADSWLKLGKNTSFNVCCMSAGYSAGWCDESLGIRLTTVEVMCKAKGDKECLFIISPPSKIESQIKKYLKYKPDLQKKVTKYEIPTLFKRKEMEESLKESEKRLRQIAEDARVWIWEVDNKGKYTYVSPFVESIIGFKPKEVIGKKRFYDFFPRHIRSDLKKETFKLFNEQEIFERYINRLETKKGKIIIIERSGSPFFDKNGKLQGYRGFDMDVTEKVKSDEMLRHRAEELERFHKLVIGRELYMVKLKSKIKRLEDKLENLKK